MKQKEIVDSLPLLDSQGQLNEEGWARYPHWTYDRRAIKASWLRVKEWDYYYVLSDDLKKGITFTISDLGYAGLIAICWLDFDTGEFRQVDTIAPLTRGKLFDEYGENGVLEFKDNKLFLRFEVKSGKRRITFRVPGLGNTTSLEGDLLLEDPEGSQSLNIATSWAENRRRFYYNRKINCLPAGGSVLVDGQTYRFAPDTAFGGLDWGRGAWTYVNRWFWSSGSGMLNGKSFGFNLGYGFSDRSPASENILFYNGIGHKLGEVAFHFNWISSIFISNLLLSFLEIHCQE